MKKAWGVSLVFFIFHNTVLAQSADLKAWIDVAEQPNGRISILALAKSLSTAQGDYNYTLKVSRTSLSGTSSNAQSGTFTLLANQKDTLSTVNYTPSDKQQITAELRVLLGHIEVARDVYNTVDAIPEPSVDTVQSPSLEQTNWSYASQRKVGRDSKGHSSVTTSEQKIESKPETTRTQQTKASILRKQEMADEEKITHSTNPQSSFSEQKEVVRDSVSLAFPGPSPAEKAPTKDAAPIEDLEIDGLVIDETRSKTGRDFYDLFYRKWQAPAQADNFSIILKEYPTRGRVARVGIEVNGRLIFQPMLQPRQDMLELVSDQAVRVVKKHFLDQKQLKAQLESEDQSGSGLF